MTVLVVGKFYTEAFGLEIAEGFEALGHRVERYEPGVTYLPGRGRLFKRWVQVRRIVHDMASNVPLLRERQGRALADAVDRARPDLTVVCHDFLWPSEVETIRERSGAPVVLWFPDAIVNFGRTYFLNAPYDVLLFHDPYVVERLGEVAPGRVRYLPQAFAPQPYMTDFRPTDADRERYTCDICNVGNMYSYRAAFFEHLVDYDLKLWGNIPPMWMRADRLAHALTGAYVNGAEKTKAFRLARVVVNNMHPGEFTGVNRRCFEVTGAGGLLMTDAKPALAGLFKDGTEILTFRTMAELRHKLDACLPDEDARRAIARAGQARAEAEHTYGHRLILLLDTVAGTADGFPMPSLP